MNNLRKSLLAGCVSLAAVGTAGAGGLERGGYNIDLLFDPARFAGEVSATYVMPDRELKNVVDTQTGLNPSEGGDLNGLPNSADETESYWVPRVGFKAGFGDSVDCMVDYSQPWGAHTNPGANWAGANNNIETKINSDNYSATCSYKFDVGKGHLRIIGGVFYQELDGFKERQVIPDFAALGTGVGRLDLAADGTGWRTGLAYEIPEIAFRASLVYNSEVELDEVTGTLDLSEVNGSTIPVFGSSAMPESVELKVQSGIAPGWLAFGSVKWVDWSQLDVISFCSTAIQGVLPCTYGGPGFATSLDLLYRDGWTVSAGVGHKFTDMISGAASITWDRGTSTGLSAQTDTWTLSAGASITPNENMEIRLGGAVGVLTSGSIGPVTTSDGTFGSGLTADFDNDFIGALSASAKLKF